MQIKWDEEKNKLLKTERGISFEEVKKALDEGEYRIEKNTKPGRMGEEVIVFFYNGYPYECAFVKDISDNNKRFLKTVHKERKRKYLFK